LTKTKIFIDAGHNHSGWNTGAAGNGMREQDITFDVSAGLSRILSAAGCGTKLSRPTMETNLGRDNASSINTRWQMANDWNADYFISIHVNAGGGTGAETFIAATKQNDRAFAQTVNDTYAESIGIRNRGVKLDSSTGHGSLGVLRSTGMPAILLELAFIDSPTSNPDVNLLRSSRDDMAQAVAEGVLRFLGINANAPPASPTPAQPGNFPIAAENIQRMVSLGVINSPDFWQSADGIQWLNELMANAAQPGILDPRVSNGISGREDAFDAALEVMRDAGIVNTPDYWRGIASGGNVPHIDNLIANMSNRARIVLEKITHAEAQGEPFEGQVAVAEVILNRHRSSRFPDGIYNVVFQNATNSQGVLTYQFTPIPNGAYARAKPSDSVKQAVTQALDGSNFTEGALFFRGIKGAEGSWHETALRPLVDIGGHRFFTN